MSSENLHVPREVLSQEARLLHYAITSLMEELDARGRLRVRHADVRELDEVDDRPPPPGAESTKRGAARPDPSSVHDARGPRSPQLGIRVGVTWLTG